MADFKNRKLLINVKEFVKTPESNMYNINGIDLAKAIFFWRLPMGMYDVIPLGFYEIVYEGDNVYLHIIDTTVYEKIESIQICYEFASISSTYDVDFNVDITTLKDRYNEVVDDIKKIYGYIEKNMMTSDALDVAVVLPQLSEDEVWLRTADGYKGYNIGDIDANIEEFWKKFAEETKRILALIEEQTTEAVNAFLAIVEDRTNKFNALADSQHDRINSLSSALDDKVQLVWRMFSVITGTQRYLSGNSVATRLYIEKELDGSRIADRTGSPKRIYTGGHVLDRNVSLNSLNIDLGEYSEVKK